MFLSGVSGGGGGHDWGDGWGRGWDLCSGGGGTVSGGFGRVSTLDTSTLLFHSWEEKQSLEIFVQAMSAVVYRRLIAVLPVSVLPKPARQPLRSESHLSRS